MAAIPPAPTRLLKLKDAAHYLAVSAWKLRQIATSGQLPYIPGTANAPWRFDLRDLDVFIEKQKVRL